MIAVSFLSSPSFSSPISAYSIYMDRRATGPKVSIITVTYNSAETIADTLQSVKDQDYPNIEHIIVDGLSKDNTMSIVSSFPHVVLSISEKDSGMYDALNKGIRAATGTYVGILNSDDYLTKTNSISLVVKALESEGVEAVFGDVKFVSLEDENKILRYCKSVGWTPEKFGSGLMPNHPTYYTKRENYDRHGFFKLDYKICADYELLIRHLYTGRIPFKYLETCLVTMRPGGLSNGSLSKRVTLNNEIIRACKENGISTNWMKISGKVFKKLGEYVFTNES